jgi:hypothetical protein
MCLVLPDGSAYVTVTSVANEHASLTQYSYRFLADEGRNFSFRFVRGAKQTHAAPRDAGTVPESILRAEGQLAVQEQDHFGVPTFTIPHIRERRARIGSCRQGQCCQQHM